MKNKGYAKFEVVGGRGLGGGGANKVYYGGCANGESARNTSRNPNSFSGMLPVENESLNILMLISYDIYLYQQIGNY